MCQGLDSLCWGWSSYLYPCNRVKTHHMILDPCVNDHLLTQGSNVSWSTPTQMDQLNIFLPNNKLKLPPNFSWDASGPAQTCYTETYHGTQWWRFGSDDFPLQMGDFEAFHGNFQECKLWGVTSSQPSDISDCKGSPFWPFAEMLSLTTASLEFAWNDAFNLMGKKTYQTWFFEYVF